MVLIKDANVTIVTMSLARDLPRPPLLPSQQPGCQERVQAGSLASSTLAWPENGQTQDCGFAWAPGGCDVQSRGVQGWTAAWPPPQGWAGGKATPSSQSAVQGQTPRSDPECSLQGTGHPASPVPALPIRPSRSP